MDRTEIEWVISQLQGDGYITEQPTLRDQFAMAALTGYLANPNRVGWFGEVAESAYMQADAMMLERDKKKD